MGISVSVEVALDTIAEVLCSALEGGSNYWYRIEDFVEPDHISPELEEEWGEYKQYSYPLSPGGPCSSLTSGYTATRRRWRPTHWT